MPEPIWLVGMMGAGKSTVAPIVAELLGRDWSDADQEIEIHSGRSIGDLFGDSEEVFRKAELDVIEALADSSLVVAAGGGAVTTDAGRVMADSGFVVWLRAEPEVLVARVGDGQGRPLVTEPTLARLAGLMAERERMYTAVADAVIDTDRLTPDEVAEEVVQAWKSSSSAA